MSAGEGRPIGVAEPLGPRTVAELLDLAFKLYRRHFPALFGIVAVVQVPYAIAVVLLGRGGAAARSAPPGLPSGLGQVWDAVFASPDLSGVGPYLLIWYLAYLLSQVALIVATSDGYLNDAASVWRAYGAVLRRLWPLSVTALLALLATVAGLVLLVVPGLYLAILFAFNDQAVLLEDASGRGGLRRSRALVAGAWWRVLGITSLASFLVGVLQAALSAGVGGLAALIPGAGAVAPVTQGVATVLGSVAIPLQAVIGTLLYYDLRIRQEGFDLERMAAQASPAAP